MIYVLSDIHGNERRFNSILKQINLQQDEDTLYVLGDVIDRHPDGIWILKTIMAMPNAKMLLGNHEYMMLRALDTPYDDNADDGRALEHWYRNGGAVTHKAWQDLSNSEQKEIVAYLRGLPLNLNLSVDGRAYQLVHGAPIELYSFDPKYKNVTHFAVWKRLGLHDRGVGNVTLIFGHTPTKHYQETVPMKLWYGYHMIGIDCGSGYPEEGPDSEYGRLACLRLDDGLVFYSEEERYDH